MQRSKIKMVKFVMVKIYNGIVRNYEGQKFNKQKVITLKIAMVKYSVSKKLLSSMSKNFDSKCQL